MNASTRKCADTRPCQRTTCYACARKLIDELASHMIDNGASESAVNDGFRYPAINALAWQIPTPKPAADKPKPKARKAFTPKGDVSYQAIADKLRVCGRRDYAAELLASATVAELDHIWSLAGREDRIPSKLRKAARMEHMIEALVSHRLDAQAILNAPKA